MSTKKLWGGRFEESAAAWIDQFGASISFDQLMANEDIEGSLAHVKMLNETGILTEQEATEIENGLLSLKDDLSAGKLEFSDQNEDIHMNIESLLTEKIGPVAGKLHTARSRNDQVATDFHLYVKKRTTEVISELNQKHTDVSPLGSCALAGTTWTIDRFFTAKELGFADVYANSLDAVSDRDFALEFLSNASILMVHLSRLCEELIYWCSYEFSYIEMSDEYSTGSSIMPQKKNPDMAELIRGKSGRVFGNLMGLLTVMKGLPLAYNKDMQEDKEGVFDAVKTIIPSIKIMTGMIETLPVNKEKMQKATEDDFSNATELADYLAGKGIPFRQAHAIVGNLVLQGIKSHTCLQDIPLEEYQKIDPEIGEDVYYDLQSKAAIERRKSYGSTGFEQVRHQIEQAKNSLN